MSLGMLAKHIAKNIDAPLVVTYHTMLDDYTHYVPVIPSSAVSMVANETTYRYCMMCDHVIAPSTNIYDKMKELNITTPISVLPTGINLAEIDSITEADLTVYGIPTCVKTIVYVGRLAKEKNLEMLLAAFEVLAKKMEDVHLIMVGGGPQHKEFTGKYKNNPLCERIHFTGFVPKTEAISIFKAASLMLFTSYTETQGIVLAESMASKTPIVATNSYAARDIIENGVEGALCDNTPENLADACYNILNDNATFSSMKEAARKRGEKYDDELLTDRLLEIYEMAERTKEEKKIDKNQ